MFKIHQIVPLQELRKGLYAYVRHLSVNPQALLITRRVGEPLVFVNGSIFEELLEFKMRHTMQYGIKEGAD